MVNKILNSKLAKVIGFAGLTLGGFYVAQYVVYEVLQLLVDLGVDFSDVNEAVFNTVAAVACYIVALIIAIGVPYLLFRHQTTRHDIGLQRLPTWSEIGLAPAGLIVYFITSAVVLYTVIQLFPGFDAKQAQEVGFTHLSQRYEYIVAFLTLVVIAPVAEEVLFRGYLYGKLRKLLPWWMGAVIVSVLFGFAHGQWNVAVDTFVLSMFACILRNISGSLWPSIMLHMLKNGLAFYLLFVNPSLVGL